MQRQGRNEKKRAWRARARSIDFEEGLSVVDGEMERKREREREPVRLPVICMGQLVSD